MNRQVWPLLLAVGLMYAPAQADIGEINGQLPPVKIRVHTVGAYQNLNQKSDNGSLPELESGLHAALANLELFTTIQPGFDVYADFYLSSRRHLGTLYAREGYVKLAQVPESLNILNINDTIFKYVQVKAGHFELDFGHQHLFRSDNAQVYKNPLIGNYVVDPNTVEGGVELMGDYDWFHWVAGAGNGVTTEKFSTGRDYSRHAKILIEPKSKRFFLAGSVYRVHHTSTTGTTTELFSALRSGSRYAGVIGPNSMEADPDAGQVFLGRGIDVTAYQVDGGVRLAPVSISGLYGWYWDKDTNASTVGTPMEKWAYWGAESKWDITDRFYAAARYSAARSALIRGVSQDGRVGRTQVGVGYRIMNGVLWKAEYVDQRYKRFKGTNPSWIGAQNPRFSGVITEIAVSFGATAFSDKVED